jgi:ABC-type multidrug transport system fused ATPase/permease subunit
LIVIFLFLITFTVQYFLFKKSSKLSIAAKERRTGENSHLLGRIINLEHIKTNSGEAYEQEKLENLLDENFHKDKKSLR